MHNENEKVKSFKAYKRKKKNKNKRGIFKRKTGVLVIILIAAIGVGLNVWFNKKAMGDPQREELIKSKFEIYKDMYLQIVLIKRSHCLNKSAREIDEIIKNYYKNKEDFSML